MNQTIAQRKENVKNLEKSLERLNHVRHRQQGVRPEQLAEIRHVERLLRLERQALAELEKESEA